MSTKLKDLPNGTPVTMVGEPMSVGELGQLIKRVQAAQQERTMYERIEDGQLIEISVFHAPAEEGKHGADVLLSIDTFAAPEVAGRLQFRFGASGTNGLTRSEWEKLKQAGDRAFAWAQEVALDVVVKADDRSQV